MTPIEVKTEVRQFFTPASLAQHLNLSERYVRELLASKDGKPARIPSYLIGTSRRIDPADVDRFLEESRADV